MELKKQQQKFRLDFSMHSWFARMATQRTAQFLLPFRQNIHKTIIWMTMLIKKIWLCVCWCQCPSKDSKWRFVMNVTWVLKDLIKVTPLKPEKLCPFIHFFQSCIILANKLFICTPDTDHSINKSWMRFFFFLHKYMKPVQNFSISSSFCFQKSSQTGLGFKDY